MVLCVRSELNEKLRGEAENILREYVEKASKDELQKLRDIYINTELSGIFVKVIL